MRKDIKLIQIHQEMMDALSVPVKISHDEVCRVVVDDLKAKLKSASDRGLNEYVSAFETVLRYYLGNYKPTHTEAVE